MNIKILAALAISVVGLSAAVAQADDRGGHGYGRGDGGRWSHDYRGGGEGRWHDRDGGYRHRYEPRYYAPRYRGYYAPSYYAPRYYAPRYYAPRYYEPAYSGVWFDDPGVVIQLHLP